MSLRTVKADEQPWWLSALCAQSDPEAFFPPRGSNGLPAKAICRRCPVTRECAADALKQGDEYGVFAGVGVAKPGSKRKLRRAAA